MADITYLNNVKYYFNWGKLMRDKSKNVILYLVKKLGGQIEGRKKLMKLMFLIEHFDLESKRIVRKKHTLGNRFFIYYYGVFSFDVMNSYDELFREKIIMDTYPLTIEQKVETRLEGELKRVIDGIVKEFGKYSGYNLEVETLGMLGIEPSGKDQYFGKAIDEIRR